MALLERIIHKCQNTIAEEPEGKDTSLIPKVVAFVVLMTVAFAEYVFAEEVQQNRRS